MNSRFLVALAFVAGLGGGWFGKTWLESNQLPFSNGVTRVATATNDDPDTDSLTTQSEFPQSSHASSTSSAINNTQNTSVTAATSRREVQSSSEGAADISIIDRFKNLLNERRYYDAIELYQEQKTQSEQIAARLRVSLLDELTSLTETRNNSDFSELIESYLSIYYDDIDVLLLLADFNRANASYHEVVNVFLLAKTYAYTHADQDKVADRFKKFVIEIDASYTGQKDWWSLINLYAHIDTSGLMTSTYQYRQALAHLRSGDEAFAIEQLKHLLDDSLIGESAAKALSGLVITYEAPIIVNTSPWDGADAIALQKLGNQYAVNLANSRQDNVNLLIDTGASMTAVSRESFNTLNANDDAVEQDRRVFRTANGLVQATVFSVPELNLGPHRLEDTQIAVIDFDSARGVDGLLGMNILGQFRFHIDQDSSNLLLSKK